MSHGMNSSFSTNILTCTELQRCCSFCSIFFAHHHNYFTCVFLQYFCNTNWSKPGFLSSGINLLPVKASSNCVDCSSSEQSALTKFIKAIRSLDELPNFLEVDILRQSSAWRPEGLEPPFVNILLLALSKIR